ncbi:alpha/beta hydrolase [Aeromicrobium sp.]|uniref:alpha/beta hydrolase n=1 Tax=Aeromicrobium sp. TaxID=1871063 RepID=UPI003C4B1871
MGLGADTTAMMMQLTARLTVRHGNDLQYAGQDLPRPVSRRVPTRHGKVAVDLYLPPGPGPGPVPAYVHLHGGAFIMRFPRMDDFFCRFVVAEAGVAVINVDYDVAPQARYPVAQEQAHDVLEWLAEHGHDWGIDAQNLAIGGFSAGANLAASACLQTRDRGGPAPRLQLLGVPSLDVAGDAAAKPSTSTNPMIGPGLLKLVRSTYFKDASRRTEPYASPLLAESVAGVAPALVITAEHDSLRTEGDAYARALDRAGLLVEHIVVPGRDHYFLDPAVEGQARGLMQRMAEGIRGALTSG